jgi:hypothetical protein
MAKDATPSGAMLAPMPAHERLVADALMMRDYAMCGRLRVGKSFLHVCRIGRCSHVFGLFARFT